MKLRKGRVMLIVIVIFIIIFAVFQVNSNNKKKNNNVTTEVKQAVFQDNIRLGISNLDTTNPLKTKNKQMMDIYQLVYEPLVSLD